MAEVQKLKIGFIGLGNMGGAIAEGLVRSGISADKIYACAGHFDKLTAKCKKLGTLTELHMDAHASAPTAHACHDAAEVADHTDVIFIAVKPDKIPELIRPAAKHFSGKLVISVAWGYTLERFQKERLLPESAELLCTIPNTPVSICKGIFIVEKVNTLTEQSSKLVEELLGRISLLIPVDTRLMDIGGIVGGCAPAFVDVFMEAMADAAVMYGVPRATAYQMVARMMEGTAALQLASGKHPAAMKDEVCSPGGSTIRGIASLEEHGFRGTVIDAVKAIEGK